MSDYLNNLAARSLNLTEMIQPRLASRFEPPNSVGGPVSAQHIDADLIDEALTSGETDLSPQPPVRTPTRPAIEPPREARLSVPELRRIPPDAPHRTPDGLTTTPGQPSAQPTRQQPRLPTHDLLPPAKMGSAHSLDQSTFDPTRLASLQPPPSMLQPAVAQPAARSAPPQPEPDRSTRPLTADGDGLSAALSRRATEQESQPRLEPAPRPMRAPAIQPIAFEAVASPMEPPPTDASHPELPAIQDVPSPIPAAIVARPQVVPYVESTTLPTLPEPAAASELASTIQVTIGRIEVRATPPPAPPPQRQRAAPPVMSLDEYLRQRTRGDGG